MRPRLDLPTSGLVTLAVLAILWPASATAEDEAVAEAAPREGSGYTIVVTADRREQSLQDVPVSMEALSSDLLQDSGLTSFDRIQQFVPNLTINPVTDSRSTVIRIRGVGSPGNNSGIDPSVGVFVDGIYQGRAGMSTGDLLDVERVEVLRGPQGTLYGKNTAAGTINIISKKPTYDIEATGEGTFGNYMLFEGRAMANAPIVDDVIATRIAAYRSVRDGFDHNRFLGDDVNDGNKMGVKSRTLFDVTNDFSFLLTGDLSYENTHCCMADIITYDGFPSLSGGNAFVPATTFDNLAAFTGIPLPDADGFDRKLDFDIEPRNRVVIGGVSVDGTWEIPSLPDLSLHAIGSWRHYKSKSEFDGDFSLYNAIGSTTDTELDQYSAELRLVGQWEDVVEYQGGLYFFHMDQDTKDTFSVFDDWLLVFPLAVAPSTNVGHNTHKTWSYAGYAQATWQTTDWLSLTGGIRLTYEKKNRNGSQVSDSPLAGIIDAPPIIGEDSFDDSTRDSLDVSGTVKLQFFPTEDTMLYASFANGFKSGGFNQLRVPQGASAEFKDEKAYSYEGGFRSTWLDQMITLNGTFFYTFYNDFQSQTFDGTAIAVRNAGEFVSYGVEADLVVAPLENLVLATSLGFNITDYEDFDNGLQTVEQRFLATGGDPAQCGPLGAAAPEDCVQDLSGKKLDNAPEWSVSSFAQYTWPTPWWPVDLFVRGEYVYRSGRFLDADLDRNVRQDQTHLGNLRAGVRDGEGRWELTGWVTNIGDENWNVAAFDVPTLTGFAGVNAPPRQYGLTLRLAY